MTIATFLWIALAAAAASYAVRVLGYSDAPGPYESRRRTVRRITRYDIDATVETTDRPVSLFDWIRLLTTRCYDVTEADQTGMIYWYVREDRIKMWTCPVCLSFWMALPYTALLLSMLAELRSPGAFLLVWGGLTGMTWVIGAFVDYCVANSVMVFARLETQEEDE